MKRLSHIWRTLATGISFFLFGLGSLTIGVLSAIFIAPLPIADARKQIWIRAFIRSGCTFFVIVMRAMGLLSLSVQRSNTDLLVGHIIVANHPTLLDAVFLIAEFNNVCCIVKQGLWRNPLTVIVVSLAGYIPNSSEQLVELAQKKLKAGENILIFPEGTRSQSDGEPLQFKRGAANIAIAASSPILPVLVQCSPPTLQKGEQWYRVPESQPRFSLMIESAVNIGDCIDISKPRTVQYRHLTRYLREYYQEKMCGDNGVYAEKAG